jgi:phosphoglycerate dehydrogenase-like enzyme
MKSLLIVEPAQTVFSPAQLSELSSTFNVTHIFGVVNMNQLGTDFGGDLVVAIDPDTIGWNLDEDTISQFKHLCAIHVPTTSFSWIDLEYCKTKGVPVTTVPNFSTQSVSEFAVMMMSMISKKLPHIAHNKYIQDFTTPFIGQNLDGKTVGIIGLGNIGTAIAKLTQGLGMNVMYWSKNSRNDDFEYSNIPDIMTTADYIFPCCASNAETKDIITDQMIKNLSIHQSVVGISEGYYNHELILERAEKSEIYGYAFDFENPVRPHTGNVLSLPQYGWYTEQSITLNAKIWCENILKSR